MKPSLNIPLRIYREGKVTFYSTDLEYLREMGIPYTKAPVFYNPRMKLNRDITISLVGSLGINRAADLMAASGVRALRLAVEGGAEDVRANDSNCLSAHIIKTNARLNSVRMKITCSDARLEAERMAWEGDRYQYVDLDPFGSPAPYLDSFLRAVRRGGILGVTATDTPPLFGIYPEKLFRYYGVRGTKLSFHKEFGIRSLISFAIRTAARFDLVARPILSYGKEHYVRIFLQIEKGASMSNEIMRNSLGWVEVCDGDYILHRGLDIPETECGEAMGPLWMDSLSDPDLLKRITPLNGEVDRLLSAILEELKGPPFYYLLDDICSKIHLRMPRIGEVISSLKEKGFQAVRTHLEPLGIKTDASRSEIERTVKELIAS